MAPIRTRRQFLQGVLGASAFAGLGAKVRTAQILAAEPKAAIPEASRALAEPDRLSGLPFRQDDPVWKDDVMWDRDSVIQTHTKGNRRPRAEAEALLREFDDGNTIGNEGCLLTCLAMVLRLLDPAESEARWTPRSLNRTAQELAYYTPAGLSMAPLFADLVSEVSNGKVQLRAKEEYLSGEPSWPRMYVSTSAPVRAFRRLEARLRRDFVVMLKTGTYDDTVASHYVLLHPACSESPDERDVELLDPAMPMDASGPCRLSDSARRICADPDIRRAWKERGILPHQIGGVWIFGHWRSPRANRAWGELLRAWAAQSEAP